MSYLSTEKFTGLIFLGHLVIFREFFDPTQIYSTKRAILNDIYDPKAYNFISRINI